MNRASWLLLALALLLLLASSQAEAAITDNLQFYYNFSNSSVSGTTVNDASGNNRDGTKGASGQPEQVGQIPADLGDAVYYDSAGTDQISSGYTHDRVDTFTVRGIFNATTDRSSDLMGFAGGVTWGVGYGDPEAGSIACTSQTYCCYYYDGGWKTAEDTTTTPYGELRDVVCKFDPNNNVSIFVNGKLKATTSISVAGSSTGTVSMGYGYAGNHYAKDTTIDEIGFWTRTLTPTEILEINMTNALTAGAADPLNISLVTPTDDDHLNDEPVNFVFNLSTNETATCDLNINGTQKNTSTGLSTGQHTLSYNLTDGNYTWNVNCTGAASETSPTRRVIVDQISPDWTVEANNFFNTANTTVWNVHTDGTSPLLNLTADDTYLWAVNVTIRNSTGGLYWNYTITGLTTNETNVTATLNLTSWPHDNYTARLYAEDDHTAKEWQAKRVEKKNDPADSIGHDPGKSTGIEVETYDGITCTISNEQGNDKSLDYEELRDRVSFTFEPNNQRKRWEFRLSCDAPISYRGELWPYPSFVVSRGAGGSWVDFNTDEDVTYTNVEQDKNGDWLVELERPAGNRNPLTLRSMGGLNNHTETYTFEVSRVPRQNENLSINQTGIDYQRLVWNVKTETNRTLIYRDGVNIHNTTNTTYNATGLTPGTTYTWTVYAEATDHERNLVGLINWSTSSENQVSGATLFNSTATINVYDEITRRLITNSNLSITFISEDGNTNFTETSQTGQYSLTNITPGEYTLRHTADGYGVRDQYLTLSNASNASVYLYLLTESDSTLLPVTVVDVEGRELTDVEVRWQRFFTNTSNYEVVEMTKTRDGGVSNLYFEPYDAWYRAIILYEGVLYTKTARRYGASDASSGIIWAIDVADDPFESYTPVIQGFFTDPNVTHDAGTRTFGFTYVDTSGLVEEVCLRVNYLIRGVVRQEINSSCSNSSTAYIYASYPATNYTVEGVVYVETTTENSLYRVANLIIERVGGGFGRFGRFGLFLVLIVVAIGGMVSGAHPSLPIVFSTAGLVVAVTAFDIPISVQTLLSVVVVGFGLIMLFSWRRDV